MEHRCSKVRLPVKEIKRFTDYLLYLPIQQDWYVNRQTDFQKLSTGNQDGMAEHVHIFTMLFNLLLKTQHSGAYMAQCRQRLYKKPSLMSLGFA